MTIINAGIYIILNKKTNKVYVGSSINVPSRIKEHKNALNKGTHHSSKLQRAYNKYKRDNFQFLKIETVSNHSCLIKREQHWIFFYNSYKNGYNCCPIAGNTLGMKHSKETKQKMSKATKGEKNGMYGKTHSLKVRKKLSELQRNKEITLKFRKKMSKATKGEKNGMYGKTHSIATKKVISKKLKVRGGHYGEKNPNYGNKWTKKMKDGLREKIKTRGGYCGERNPNNKIKNQDIKNIVRLKVIEGESIIKIANKYHVCGNTIYNVLKKAKNYVKTN